MTTSLPSREIVNIDVPEVEGFSAQFHYNFHVPDESVSSDVSLDKKYLQVIGDRYDAKAFDYLNARLPRYIKFEFLPVHLSTTNERVDEQTQGQSNGSRRNERTRLITENFSKIVTEEEFTSNLFLSIKMSDPTIDKKLFNVVSSSANILNDSDTNRNSSFARAVRQLNQRTTHFVSNDFLSTAMSQPSEKRAFFISRDGKRARNEKINNLKDVGTHLQINSKFFDTLVNHAISNVKTNFAVDLFSLANISKGIQTEAVRAHNPNLSLDQYQTTVQYIDLQPLATRTGISTTDIRVIGYVLDKSEILSDGTIINHKPIIVESGYANAAYDAEVKYAGNYQYTIRCIALVKIPVVAKDSSDSYLATFLVSSKPSAPIRVPCVELVPPPSPADLNGVWDYENRRFVLHWCFPPNRQRDIKKFQVFRRTSINTPFELLREYDFDDSVIRAPNYESPDEDCVERLTNPKTFYTDDEFTKDSRFIYAVCSVDAHGMTSGYSMQFEFTFDRYRNKLIRKLISVSGAPKNYPNLHLQKSLFADAIVSEQRKTMHVSFEPEYLKVIDSKGLDKNLFFTSNKGGDYIIQVINTDLQQAQTISMTIEDRRSEQNSVPLSPSLSRLQTNAKILKKSI